MKDQLIEFDTAVLAKKKGFNIPTNTYFRERNKEPYINMSFSEDWNSNERERLDYFSIRISRMTQSLLQQWLWNKHKLWIDICLWDGFFSYMIKEFTPISETDSGRNYYVFPRGKQGTDEDPFKALEAGLIEALNYIKK